MTFVRHSRQFYDAVQCQTVLAPHGRIRDRTEHLHIASDAPNSGPARMWPYAPDAQTGEEVERRMAAPTRGHTQIPRTTNQIGREDWPAFYLAVLNFLLSRPPKRPLEVAIKPRGDKTRLIAQPTCNRIAMQLQRSCTVGTGAGDE